MTLEELKALYEKAKELHESGLEFDISIGDKRGSMITNGAKLAASNFKVADFKQAALVKSKLDPNFQLSVATAPWLKKALKEQSKEVCKDNYVDKTRDLGIHGHLYPVHNLPNLYKNGLFNNKDNPFPSVKFMAQYIGARFSGHFSILNAPPLEIQQDEVTYRTVMDGNGAALNVFEEKHPHYQFMDKGHILYFSREKFNFGGQVADYNYWIMNELTPETYLVSALLCQNSTFIRFLTNEVFLNSATAKMVRLRMEKEMGAAPGWYTQMRQSVFTDFDKVMNDDLLGKIIAGTLKSGSYNDIKLSQTSAAYEDVVITAPDLLAMVSKQIVFDQATDIYTIYRGYVHGKLTDLNRAQLLPVTDEDIAAKRVTVIKDTKIKTAIPPKTKVKAEDGEEDEEDEEDTKEEAPPDTTDELAFELTVNGYNVKVSRVPQNTRRYINGYPIKMEELERVCYRASCLRTQEHFDNFVKAVSDMSLEWHDALAEGIRVKIQDGLSYSELKEPTAPLASPKITFRREEGVIGVVISETKEFVPVRFNAIIKELKRINRQTNGHITPALGYGTKNPVWARMEIYKALKSCCTFTTKELVVDAEGNPVLDAEGKKQYTKVETCKITDEQARFVEKMARDYYARAREREKEFLRIAVEKTGARLETVNNEQFYIVQGSLRQYAVHAESNQVKEFPSMRHICIVEQGHVVSTGGDATAARLYALKNDKYMTSAIGTLAR